ncbi:futalosine hydrolase [Streptomyces sp. KR80]|uniref:futalosine hydrolase n=1 Tax=Streptomyces sp. KR80 TaxID=3457426 RepID=UPI003FD4605C
MRVLVVTAVRAEADAVQAGLREVIAARAGAASAADAEAESVRLPGSQVMQRLRLPALILDVLASGAGPAAAAAGACAALTAAALTSTPYDLVVSAGIGGGFPAVAPVGAVVVADAIVAGDLGAETPDGFLPVDELGFGRTVRPTPPGPTRHLVEALEQAGRPAVLGPVLTVSTVTGSAARAAELLARHPRAAAEAMEGFGVAEAAALHEVPVLEIRAVSNAVGPRDRAAWRIGQALDSLRYAVHLLIPIVEEEFR